MDEDRAKRMKVHMRLRGEQGQNSFEYVLVVGAIVVALASLLILGFSLLLPEVLGLLCPSVDTSADPSATFGSCLGG